MSDGDAGWQGQRLVFPAFGRIYAPLAPMSYAIMRFATGAVLVPHGVQKVLFLPLGKLAGGIAQHGLPAAHFLAACTYFSELVAASCVALGLFTRPAALMIWIEMTVVITVFQWQYGYFWTNRGIEYALLWWLLCIAIFFRGGGRYSLDRLIGWEF